MEGIFQTSPAGRYLSVNPTLARIYAYESPQQMISELNDISRQLYVNPDRRRQFAEALEQQDTVCGFESQIYRRDQEVIWISENAQQPSAMSTVGFCTMKVRSKTSPSGKRPASGSKPKNRPRPPTRPRRLSGQDEP